MFLKEKKLGPKNFIPDQIKLPFMCASKRKAFVNMQIFIPLKVPSRKTLSEDNMS